MKIERPGKACAITPVILLKALGPFFKMENSSSTMIQNRSTKTAQISSIWDNGELVLGYGEFMENNKNLVPAAYSRDWWVRI